MELVFENFGKCLLILIWVICGIVAVWKDPGVLWLAGLATVFWSLSQYIKH